MSITLKRSIKVGLTCDNFPPYVAAPAITSYVSGGTFNNTYYIATTGNDTTGDGSIGTPWASINGARTGGAGTPAAAGDNIQFRGGTYDGDIFQTGWKDGGYYFDIDGTATDYIVFSAYSGETPTFTATGQGYCSIHIKADYIVLDGLTVTTGNIMINHYHGTGTAENCVVQNCTFDGIPYDPFNDQPSGHHVILSEYSSNTVIRNNYFKGTANQANDIAPMANFNGGAYPSISGVKIIYNRFENIHYWFGAVNHKGSIYDWETAYNRFENVTCCIGLGPTYYGVGGNAHNLYDIHHNAADGIEKNLGAGLRGAFFKIGGSSAFDDANNITLRDNLMINSVGNAAFILLSCGSGSDCNSGGTAFGEVYNNAVLGSVDMIDPWSTTDFSVYPSYLNFNAYESTANRDTAENVNSLPASSWQGSALVQAAHGVTRTGLAGDRFYTITNDNGFVGAGRGGIYSSTIGGFVFS